MDKKSCEMSDVANRCVKSRGLKIDMVDYQNDEMLVIPEKSNSTKDVPDRPSLLPFRCGFFTLFAALGVFASFLPLYLKQLGLDPEEIGTVMFFRPFGGFVGGLVTPHVVSKFHTQTLVTVAYTILFLVFAFSLNFLSPPPFATHCAIWNMDSNSSTTNWSLSEIDKGLTDRASVYCNDNMWSLILFACVMIFCADFFAVGTDVIQHGIIMKSLGAHNNKSYGLIRSFGSLGHAVSTLLTGLVVSFTVTKEITCAQLLSSADYHVIFYVFLVFACTLILNSANLYKDDGDTEDQTLLPGAEFRAIMCTPRNLSWLFILFSRSVCYAVTQGFLYWHMEYIGASPVLIGASNCVSAMSEFFMFFWTPFLMRQFGHSLLASVGFASYICRFILFYLISDPIFILPVEVLEGVMYACLWSSIVSHLSSQVPSEGQNQVQGLIQSLYMFGLGVGFIASGILTQELGAPTMFVIFAAMSSAAFILFVLAQLITR